MKDITHIASLLTYLEPVGNKFFLKLSPITQDSALPEENIFPSIMINDSDPLARLIEARIVSDAGSEVRRLFLFVQRDWYTLKKNELWPFNNIDVRDSWQKAFSFYAERKQEDQPFILLSHQLSNEGEIVPFSSLFYCTAIKAFFHPPCPTCGRLLQQCEDDNRLIRSGLHPFSTSLKRYLFCSGCDSPDFFVYERDQTDPSSVKDRQTLIKNFAELKNAEGIAAFPCSACHHHEECYGKDNRVLTRVIPVSFYPFYMFAFEAMSVNALDFIALISGANFEEAESLPKDKGELGRVACLKAVRQAYAANTPFLFDHDERHFLEILYLKLSFLGEVIQSFKSGGKFINPELRPGIDQIWVKLPEHGGLLPFFWNFEVKILGIAMHTSPSLLSKPGLGSLFLMGLIWFYTLLTNKRQDISDVFVYLERFSSEEHVSFEKYVNESVFNPANIFWDPQGKIVASSWTPIWERSLKMGWSLLNSDFQNVDWGGEQFLLEMQDLRKDIRENLFLKEIKYTATIPNAAKTVSHSAEDDAIHEILVAIISKLRPRLSKKKEAEEIGEPFTETVILSARPYDEQVKFPPTEETLITRQTAPIRQAEDELQETVILSLENLEKKTKSQPPKVNQETDNETQKEKMSVEDFLAETVILRPGEKSKNGTKK